MPHWRQSRHSDVFVQTSTTSAQRRLARAPLGSWKLLYKRSFHVKLPLHLIIRITHQI